jgi:hypothetical protein
MAVVSFAAFNRFCGVLDTAFAQCRQKKHNKAPVNFPGVGIGTARHVLLKCQIKYLAFVSPLVYKTLGLMRQKMQREK